MAVKSQLQQERHQAHLKEQWKTSKELRFESVNTQKTEGSDENSEKRGGGGEKTGEAKSSFIRIFQSNLDKKRQVRGGSQPKGQLGQLY